ncbi:DUF262 domain-containing protein [Listeria fleischmannii]|uniref:GmrSD restriction endonucleases N-terminal domain-containing protein n=1 Tax=Listeria fleischmannii FSL S10-1203 TaxID=1265822 RepID=W7DYJ0_9LIST|nr:DUF262 domain-containing protein [Listeria fleischmannii]EUJ56436.1 hypothetical protein MCOL2_08976 [Listeria fleischmannii FSL S10-1203]
MDKSTKPWSVKQMKTMHETKQTLSFEHPIQRKGTQWDKYQQSLFIHSLLTGYPVPAIFTTKVDGVNYVLDGKQRLETIFAFLNDEFTLHIDTPLVDGFDASDMFFSELTEEIQDNLRTTNLSITQLEDCTDDDLEEVFFRLNHGTPLSSIQKTKARLGASLAAQFDKLTRHSFFSEVVKFTKTQIKKEDDLKAIIQTMMLDDLENLGKFTVTEVCKFAEQIENNEKTQMTLEILEKTFDYLLMALNSKDRTLLKPVHLPMLMHLAYKKMDKFGFNEFADWYLDFTVRFKLNENDGAASYKAFCGAGSTASAKVKGRAEEMERDFMAFVQQTTEV